MGSDEIKRRKQELLKQRELDGEESTNLPILLALLFFIGSSIWVAVIWLGDFLPKTFPF